MIWNKKVGGGEYCSELRVKGYNQVKHMVAEWILLLCPIKDIWGTDGKALIGY